MTAPAGHCGRVVWRYGVGRRVGLATIRGAGLLTFVLARTFAHGFLVVVAYVRRRAGSLMVACAADCSRSELVAALKLTVAAQALPLQLAKCCRGPWLCSCVIVMPFGQRPDYDRAGLIFFLNDLLGGGFPMR